MSADDLDEATLVGTAVRGPDHEEEDIPCQDGWHGRLLPGGRFAVAVGDGLGSAELSHVGSELATERAVDRLEMYLTNTESIDRESSSEAVREAVIDARKAVAKRADEHSRDPSELNTTLLVAVAGPSGVAGAAVGDGGIVSRSDGENELFVPREMTVVDVEHHDVTVPIMSNIWEESYRFNHLEECDCLAVFSDGVDPFAWDGRESVKDEFFDQMFALVRSTSDPEEAAQELHDYLDSERFRKYSGDDKTVALGMPASTPNGAVAEDGEASAETVSDVRGVSSSYDKSTPAEEFEGEQVETESIELSLDESIRERRDGQTYRIKGSESGVVEVLAMARRTAEMRAKVEAMIANPPSAQSDGGSFIWPEEVVETKTGDFLGYRASCPVADARSILEWPGSVERTGESSRTIVESLLAIFGVGHDRQEPTDGYDIGYELSAAVNRLHRQGHAIGDMDHQNILVGGSRVVFVGCESFHIDGDDGTYAGEPAHPRYAPPKDQVDTIQEVRRADQFGLGIHIFQLLMDGYHPYRARGPEAVDHDDFADLIRGNAFPYRAPHPDLLEPPAGAPPYDDLPHALRRRFEACFIEGKTHPRVRPLATDWVETLDSVPSTQR